MKAKITPHPEPKKPGKDTVYVDVDDEITAIIDKVEATKEKVVALVLPKRAAMLQSIVNMRLLKRSADSAGKNVVLITSEAALLPLAGAAGLHVAKNLQSRPEIPPSPRSAIPVTEEALPTGQTGDAEEVSDTEETLPTKLDYHRSIGELAAAGAGEEAESIALGDDEAGDKPSAAAKPPKNRKLAVPNFDRFRLLLGGGILALVALIVFIILALTVFPHAKITIATTSTPVSANFTLNTSDKATALDEEKGVIPAVLKTQDQTASQQVPATGQQNNGNKATGSATMTAQECAPNLGNTPGDVPAGTGISSNGLNFITQKKASFHFSGASGSCINYSTGAIDITAQSAGTKYNVSNATFTVAGRSDVSATGSASGGTDNNVTVVSQSDVDSVKAKITGQNSDNFSKQFQSQLGDQGYYVITQTLKAADPLITASPDVGQAASNSTVTVKVTFTVLVVGKKELSQAVNDQLNKQIDQGKERISDSDPLNGLSVSVQNQSSPTAATLSISKETTAVPIIDANTVKKQVGGKKSGDIRSLISSYPGVKNVDVKFSPFWVSSAPKSPGKITVIMQQVKSSGNGGGG